MSHPRAGDARLRYSTVCDYETFPLIQAVVNTFNLLSAREKNIEMAFTIFLLLMLISAKLSSGENDYMTAIARDGVQRALLPTKAVLPAEEAKNATTCNIDRLLLDIVTRQEKKASEELNKCFETLLNGTSAKCHGQWMQLMRRVEASHGNDTNGTRCKKYLLLKKFVADTSGLLYVNFELYLQV